MARDWRASIVRGCHNYVLRDTNVAIDATKTLVLLDGSDYELLSTQCTLGSGAAGQVMILTCTDKTNPVAIKVVDHEDGANQIFTYGAVGEYLVLRWIGQYWETLEKSSDVTQSS